MHCVMQGVAKGTLTVGDTILFLSLLSQLYAPLNYFGARGLPHCCATIMCMKLESAQTINESHEHFLQARTIGTYSSRCWTWATCSASLRPARRSRRAIPTKSSHQRASAIIQAPMLAQSWRHGSITLMQDDEGAKPLVLSTAAIDFTHVTHEYTPGNPVLRDVTFSVPGGSTTALVRVTARRASLTKCGAACIRKSLQKDIPLGMEVSAASAMVAQSSQHCCMSLTLRRALMARSDRLAAASRRCCGCSSGSTT